MKRRVSLRVDVELEASTPTGIDEAAEEALALVKCDSFIDCGHGQYQSVKMLRKSFVCQDEHLLLDLVLQATGVTGPQFIKSRKWCHAQARNMFAFFAKRYFEWSWNQIAEFIQRDRSTTISGAQSIGSLLARSPGKVIKQGLGARHKRIECVIEAVEKVRMAWSHTKE